jgi:hypothetical protein
MRIDRRLVGFGLFLVTVGIAMVAVRQGLIPEETARRAWSLWPLLLIGTGLSIILAGRPGAAIGGLIVAVTLGVFVGLVVATGSFAPRICGDDAERGTAFADTGGDLQAAARVRIEQSCGDLHVSAVAGSHWSLGGVSSDARPPAIETSPDQLRIHSRDGSPFDLGGSSTWNLGLPRVPAIELQVQTNAGDAVLALGGANLTTLSIHRNAGSIAIDLRDAVALGGLDLEVNAGSATLWLPSRSVSGNVAVNAGSLALCLPAAAGLSVDIGDNVAASNDFEAHGLTRSGDRWQTPGFATAAVRIELAADANAASLLLDPPDACGG